MCSLSPSIAIQELGFEEGFQGKISHRFHSKKIIIIILLIVINVFVLSYIVLLFEKKSWKDLGRKI